MPQTETTTALMKKEDGYQLRVTDIGPTGEKDVLSVPLVASGNWQQWSLLLRAALLKKTTWAKHSIPEIIFAILYADQMGLDIIAGDVYSVDGRLNTTTGAKIRHAMSTGRVAGYHVKMEEGPETEIPWETKSKSGVWKGPNYKATVTVHVKGWDEAVTYETTLKEWFKGDNPNWRERPAYMLRRNALSKLLEEVCPMGVESDEAPPVVAANAVAVPTFEEVKSKPGGNQ